MAEIVLGKKKNLKSRLNISSVSFWDPCKGVRFYHIMGMGRNRSGVRKGDSQISFSERSLVI